MQRYLVVVAVAVFLGGCGKDLFQEPAILKAYSGADQSDAQLAIIDQWYCGQNEHSLFTGAPIQRSCVVTIKKDDHLYYDITRDFALTIKLQPGEYVISYSTPSLRSDDHSYFVSARLDLKAGHSYVINQVRHCASLVGIPVPVCGSAYFWIEDGATGDVVAGKRPGWGGILPDEVPSPVPTGPVPTGPVPTGPMPPVPYCPPTARAEFTRCSSQ